MIGDKIKQRRIELGMTQEELAHKMGYKSKSTINKIEMNINDVIQSNIVKFAKVLDTTPQFLMDWNTQPTIPSNVTNIIPLEKIRKIPILGTICAGDGIWCDENYQGYFVCDKKIKADFCLEVVGDSMIDAKIYDGDIAFIKKVSMVDNGRIAAVLIQDDNMVTLKKMYVMEDTVILQPCNAIYEPIIAKDVLVLGELVGVYHEVIE